MNAIFFSFVFTFYFTGCSRYFEESGIGLKSPENAENMLLKLEVKSDLNIPYICLRAFLTVLNIWCCTPSMNVLVSFVVVLPPWA